MQEDSWKKDSKKLLDYMSKLSKGGNKQGLAYRFLNAVKSKNKSEFEWLLDRLLIANAGEHKELVQEIVRIISHYPLDYSENLERIGHIIVLGLISGNANSGGEQNE